MRLPAVSKILKEASEIRGRKNKIEFLRSHHPNKLMLTLLQYAFDPNIEFDLPPGDPPYTPCDFVDQDTRLYQEGRKLYMFIKSDGHASNIHPLKKETIFIQILESVDPEDAKLLVAVKDKKIPYKGITEKLIREAFPNLLSEKNEQDD
jgi:hypothetical protein